MTFPGLEEVVERIVIVEPQIETIEIIDETIHAFVPVVEQYTYSHQGHLGRYEGTTRQYVETAMSIETIRIAVNQPPAGDDVIVDVRVNGTSVFAAGERPHIPMGVWSLLIRGEDLATRYMAAGQYLTADVVQVGSVFPGADLTVTVRLQSVPAVSAP